MQSPIIEAAFLFIGGNLYYMNRHSAEPEYKKKARCRLWPGLELCVSFEESYFVRSCFTRVDMRRPSARPARRLVATPITLPMSDG